MANPTLAEIAKAMREAGFPATEVLAALNPSETAVPAAPAKATRKATKTAATIPCLSLTHFSVKLGGKRCACYGTDTMPIVDGRVQSRRAVKQVDGTYTVPDEFVPFNFAWVATRNPKYWYSNALDYLSGRGFEVTPAMREASKSHSAFAGINDYVSGVLESAGLGWDAIGGFKLPIGPTKTAVYANRAAITAAK